MEQPGVPKPSAPSASVPPAAPAPPPATTVPATTVPATTVPPTTVPAMTVPATTVPPTTVPATTVPPTTVPPTNVPPTNVPPTTVPPTTATPAGAAATVRPVGGPNVPTNQIPGLENYRKVERPKEASRVDEVRVTGRGRVSMYVSYIGRLFAESKRPITVRATGKAVSIAVAVVEVTKRRFKDLHQMTTIGVTDIVDEYEPLEVGLEKQSFTRSVTFISILLTFDGSTLDKSNPGYQEPLPESMVDERPTEDLVNPNRRGTGRSSRRSTGGRGRGGLRTSDDQTEVTNSVGRGRGRRATEGVVPVSSAPVPIVPAS